MKSCCDKKEVAETKKNGFKEGFHDYEWLMTKLTRSLPGNLRLRQKYKLETLIKFAIRNSCRDIHLSNWDKSIDKKIHH